MTTPAAQKQLTQEWEGTWRFTVCWSWPPCNFLSPIRTLIFPEAHPHVDRGLRRGRARALIFHASLVREPSFHGVCHPRYSSQFCLGMQYGWTDSFRMATGAPFSRYLK